MRLAGAAYVGTCAHTQTHTIHARQRSYFEAKKREIWKISTARGGLLRGTLCEKTQSVGNQRGQNQVNKQKNHCNRLNISGLKLFFAIFYSLVSVLPAVPLFKVNNLKTNKMTTKTASVKTAQGAVLNGANGALTAEKNENTALTVVKKKMTVAEKIDSLHKLEALAGKVEYLQECKSKVEAFGNGRNGFQNAKMRLEDDSRNDIMVSNPAIVEELLGIAKMRLQEALIKAEKEVEAFEII